MPVRLRPVLAGALLSLVCALGASQVRAQDGGVREDSAGWATWSRGFAERLENDGRFVEAAEEMYAAALYDANETDLLCRAAELLVLHGSQGKPEIAPGSPNHIFAHQCIALAVARGAASADRGEPPDPRMAFAAGRLAWERRAHADAHARLREAFEGGYDRETALLWYFRAVVNDAPGMVQRGDVDGAVEALLKVLELAPDHADRAAAEVNLADAYRSRSEQVEAERVLRGVVERNPGLAQAWVTLGLVLKDQGRLEEALEAFRRSITILAPQGAPYHDPILECAVVLHRLDRLDEALAEAERFLAMRRDDPAGTYRLSAIHKSRGEMDKALALARRCVRWRPDLPLYLLHLREVLYACNDPALDDELEEVTRRHKEVTRRYAEEHGLPLPADAREDDE